MPSSPESDLLGQAQINGEVLIEIEQSGRDRREVAAGPECVDHSQLRRDVAHPHRRRQPGRPIALGLAVAVEIDSRLHRERRPAQPADDAAGLHVPRQMDGAGDREVVTVAAFLVSELLRRAHRPEVVLVVADAVALAVCQRVGHLNVVGAVNASAELGLDCVVPARGVVLHHLHFAEVRNRPRVRGADRPARRQVRVVGAELFPPQVVHVVDVERRRPVDLPADARRRVPRIRQDVIVLNQEQRPRAARRDIVGQALATEHGVDVRIVFHQGLVGDQYRRAQGAILRGHLEILSVSRRVASEPRPADEPALARDVPRRPQPGLEIRVVVAAVRSDELVQVRVGRVGEQRVAVIDQTQVGVEVITQAEIQADAVGHPPRILDEGVGRLGVEGPVPRRLHCERYRIGSRVVDVERQVGRELEIPGLEEMRVVLVMAEFEVAAELEVMARGVDVEGVEDLVALAGEILRHRRVLAETR